MKPVRGLVASLVFMGVLVGLALSGFVAGVRPVLGLDLEGGVRVVLTAPSGTDREVMERALENIRSRIDALGVAEPELFVTGNNIEAQIPGLARGTITERDGQFCVISSADKNLGCKDSREEAEALVQATGQERLIELIGTTARLEQRQVLEEIPGPQPGEEPIKQWEELPVTCAGEAEKLSPECSFSELSKKEVVYLGCGTAASACEPGTPEANTKFRLGPVEITGDAIQKATAVFQSSAQTGGTPGWSISFALTKDGSAKFGEVTRKLVEEQLAIILDQQVISAPRVVSAITGGSGEITGSFTEQEAKDLATVLNAGALPVQLTKSQVETVSATLGKESLNQGLIAGIAGLVLLAAYLAFYYRLLGIVTWFGMAIWGILSLGLISFLGRVAGYSLTLAGVAGLIVSLGVTADSYIVFYERLKDEVRRGRSVRSAVVPAFSHAWGTIIAADIVTILAAAVLYLVAISSVRGFALTLGLATGLDMLVVYFFKRPLVFLLVRSERLTNMRGFGLTSGVAAAPVKAGTAVPEASA
ncbi:MAG: protein translocase subunit SecD [Actinomycetota bacterium]